MYLSGSIARPSSTSSPSPASRASGKNGWRAVLDTLKSPRLAYSGFLRLIYPPTTCRHCSLHLPHCRRYFASILPHTSRPIGRRGIDNAARQPGRRPVLQYSEPMRIAMAIRRAGRLAARYRAAPATPPVGGALASLQVRDMCACAIPRVTFLLTSSGFWRCLVLHSSEKCCSRYLASFESSFIWLLENRYPWLPHGSATTVFCMRRSHDGRSLGGLVVNENIHSCSYTRAGRIVLDHGSLARSLPLMLYTKRQRFTSRISNLPLCHEAGNSIPL